MRKIHEHVNMSGIVSEKQACRVETPFALKIWLIVQDMLKGHWNWCHRQADLLTRAIIGIDDNKQNIIKCYDFT